MFTLIFKPVIKIYNFDAGWSSQVARQAHNLKVVGSNPAPATNLYKLEINISGFFYVYLISNHC